MHTLEVNQLIHAHTRSKPISCEGQLVKETPPPLSLQLPSGSFGDPQTGAPDNARLDACSPHQHVCVFR